MLRHVERPLVPGQFAALEPVGGEGDEDEQDAVAGGEEQYGGDDDRVDQRPGDALAAGHDHADADQLRQQRRRDEDRKRQIQPRRSTRKLRHKGRQDAAGDDDPQDVDAGWR